MKKRISTLLMVMFALFTCQQTALAQEAAQIYFEQTEVSYDLVKSDTEPFVAPKLVNPDGVQVGYQASDYTIATVNYYNGEVTIFKEGVVTITADTYSAGSASYVLTVTDTRQDPNISYEITEVTYDITSGLEFVAPVLNNPNNVPITYTSTDFNVADVDGQTGTVTIKGVGEAVVRASSNAVNGFKPSSAEYKIKVFDPEIIYSQSFAIFENGWTEEGTQYLWNWNFYGYMACSANWNITDLTESYFVSPEIDLDTAGNIFTFEHMAIGFNNFAEQTRLVAREKGGEWIDCGGFETPDEGTFTKSGKIKLPETLNGKKAQIAFKYITDGSTMVGNWYIKNVQIKKYIKKADPQISFDVTEITQDISSPFKAPVLNNPNNVEIEYSTTNAGIATIDSKTGDVKLLQEGDVTVIATSKENKEFDSATASYVIHAVDKLKIFSETFAQIDNSFTKEGNMSGIWNFLSGYAYASGGYNATEPTDCFLVSPEITLKSENKFEFEQIPQYYYEQDISTIAKFAIRTSNGEEKGEWTFIPLNYPASTSWGAEKTGLIEIPAEFNNKTVQVAFDYVANGTSWEWWIRNLVIRGKEAPVEKVDPELSFAAGDIEAILGQEFTAPALNNPNNVEVKYSSNKPEVATVDAVTGAVTLVGEGFTTITATSTETEKYNSVSVNYVLTVLPASAADILFKETFGTSLGEFTVDGYNGENNDIWQYKGGFANADAYQKISDPVVSRLVSPVIKLDAVGNFVSFDYNASLFAEDVLSKSIMLSVREENGEWIDLELPVCVLSDNLVSCGDIMLPSAFAGKNVQVALKYYAKSSHSAGIWNVTNFVVMKSDVTNVKLTPELAFDVTEVAYTMGEEFTAPVLNNKNGLEVAYSTSDDKIATVDAATGEVKFIKEGVVTITATSVETDLYESAAASYTVTVTVPTSINGISADDLKNGKVYDLQGRRVNELSKGVFIVNGKKVVVK